MIIITHVLIFHFTNLQPYKMGDEYALMELILGYYGLSHVKQISSWFMERYNKEDND